MFGDVGRLLGLSGYEMDALTVVPGVSELRTGINASEPLAGLDARAVLDHLEWREIADAYAGGLYRDPNQPIADGFRQAVRFALGLDVGGLSEAKPQDIGLRLEA